MPAALSPDLRRRIVTAYARGGVSMPALAKRFAVSVGSVGRFVKRHRAGDAVTPTVRATSASRRVVQPEHDALIDAWLAAEPSLAQHRLATRLSALLGRVVSQQTAGEALRRMGYTYKKKVYVRPSK